MSPSGSYLTASFLEIVEIGESDKEGLLRVNLSIDHGTSCDQDVWVKMSSLLKSGLWRIDRRRGDPLTGERRKEITGTGEVPLRCGDTKRKLLRAQRCS